MFYIEYSSDADEVYLILKKRFIDCVMVFLLSMPTANRKMMRRVKGRK